MTLRDRIAETLHRISCDHLELDVKFGDDHKDTQARFYEDADAILALPEIAALREVAKFATCVRLNEAMLLEEPSETVDRRVSILTMHRNSLDAALARLEEARRD